MSLPVTAEPLPTSYTFGKVVGRVIHLIADTAEDTDDKPQARAAAGRVTFAPKEVLRKTVEADYPAIVLHATESATLSGSGRVLDAEGRQGIWLAAGIYTVTFEVTGAPRAIPSFDIQVTAEHTDEAPLDLAKYVPYVPPTGAVVQTVVIPTGGTEGQVLVRDANGGLVWTTPAVAGVSPDELPAQMATVAADEDSAFAVALRSTFVARDSVYLRDFLTDGASEAANRTAFQTAIDEAQDAGKALCVDGAFFNFSGDAVSATADDFLLWGTSTKTNRLTNTTRGKGVISFSGQRSWAEGVWLDGANPTVDLANVSTADLFFSYGAFFGPTAHDSGVRNIKTSGLMRGVMASTFPLENITTLSDADAVNETLYPYLRNFTVDGIECVNCWSALQPISVDGLSIRRVVGNYIAGTVGGADPHLIYGTSAGANDGATPAMGRASRNVRWGDCHATGGELAPAYKFRSVQGLTITGGLTADNTPGLFDLILVEDFSIGDGCVSTDDTSTTQFSTRFLHCKRGTVEPIHIRHTGNLVGTVPLVNVTRCEQVHLARPRLTINPTVADANRWILGLHGANPRVVVDRPQITNLGASSGAGIIVVDSSPASGPASGALVLDPRVVGDWKLGARMAFSGASLVYDPDLIDSTTSDVQVDGGVTAALTNRKATNPSRAQALITARGLLAENYPAIVAGSSTALSNGTIYLLPVGVLAGDVITHIPVGISAPGAAGGQTLAKVGLYDLAGNLLAVSANQGAAWETGGTYSVPLLTPYTVPASGALYVAYLATNTGTNVSMMRTVGPTVLSNPFGSATAGLWRTGGLNQTDLPATVSVSTTNVIGWWAGLIGTSAA